MADGLNATARAWEMLGAERYEELCSAVLCLGGTMVQDEDFMLVFKVSDRVAEVLFACGDLRRIIRFAKANKRVFGYDHASWVRSLVGKRADARVYDIDRL